MCRKHVEGLERVWKGLTRMLFGLKSISYKESLGKLGLLFSGGFEAG